VIVRLVIGLVITALVLAVAARRAWWLYRLISSGQPAHDRTDQVPERLKTQLLEVFGQRKLLKWSVPGLAHLFTFWAFVILGTVYLEAYGALFDEKFAIPFIGHWPALGFLQDFIALAVTISLGVFAVIRIRNAPERRERDSRFYGSHTGPAWFILFMIFNVVWTLFFFRGAASAAGNLPYKSGAFFSITVGKLFSGLSDSALFVLESVGLFLHIGVMLGFLIIVLYSKHLHIFIAPINVSAKRLPKGLGPLLPMESNGKPINFEDPGEDDNFGRGKIEDFTWKGMLDFATCTECGRCQSQCPAWNTGKPLSPKLVIMDLRDHLFAKAPYIIGGKDMPEEGSIEPNEAHAGHGVPESGFGRVTGSGEDQALRPLVGTLEAGGVIDPDVLWSCTSCGACVEQCPVDIEHVDHIIDMRRHQVMIESEFPTELGVLFKNLENKGNPWGQNAKDRLEWTKGLDFEVPVYDGELSADTEYLFWIGCAGAYDDNAKKTVRATAELLHRAGVDYVVLGQEETCTGDPARRSGNEFIFQMLASQNVEVLNSVFEGREAGKRKIVTTCPHCFNTIGREYPQLDGHYEVVHHTQLLNQLIREKKLVPVSDPSEGMEVTYHDPCYLGRHNEVYSPPRELVGAAGLTLTEMPRHADRSFCCGAGGARMWMEEHIGKRVNLARTEEALATEAKQIATGCPFCRTMLTDGVTEKQNEGVGEGVQVMDVAQMLLTSVRRGDASGNGHAALDTAPAEAAPAGAAPAGAEEAPAKEAPAEAPAAEAPSEPELTPMEKAAAAKTKTAPEADAKPEAEAKAEPSAEAKAEPSAAAAEEDEDDGLTPMERAAKAKAGGGTKAEPKAEPKAEAKPAVEAEAKAEPAPQDDDDDDLTPMERAAKAKAGGATKTEAKPEPKAEPKPEPEAQPEASADDDDDLTPMERAAKAKAAGTKTEPEPEAKPEPEVKAEAKPEPKAEPEAEAEATAKTEAKAEPAPQDDADDDLTPMERAAKAKAAGTKTEPKPEAKPEPEPEPEAKAEPEPEAKPEPEAEPKAEAQTETEPKVEPEATPEPKAEAAPKVDEPDDGLTPLERAAAAVKAKSAGDKGA
jgi:Fe-S oxidoreductase